MYRLSLPLAGSSKNSNVLVYNHQDEDKFGIGAWTEYTNYPATGWANLNNSAYFSTYTGSVYKQRNAGDATDYRDDADAVDNMVILLRAEDFGVSGTRKDVPYVTTHLQMKYSGTSGTTVKVAYDLQTPFESAGSLDFTAGADKKVVFAKASVPRRKMNYIQVKYENNTKDELVILAGIDYTVNGLTYKGVTEVDN
jgi:hypothetical protein